MTRQLLEQDPAEIRIFSRGEIAQVDMQRTFDSDKLRFIIGDVRDACAVHNAVRGVDYVFSLAALKHVPICENQPLEAIQTNVHGINNVIQSCITCKVKKFVDVSTDKAVDPINLYGMTKAIGEKLTIQANCLTKETEFICIRGGNVLGTNGSLVPYALQQIAKGENVKLTDISMTRFLLTLREAIKLLLYATEKGVGGETYVMNMPSFFIHDLLLVLTKNTDSKIRHTGAREGEKLHEVLISRHEASRARIDGDEYFIINPELRTGRFYKASEGINKEVTSYTNLAGKGTLIQLLKEGGYIK